ncbi:mitotic checkpoint regulator, MAD2B-interacting-domain-containing protein [Xylaria sp. CBS 124048]|nr:mitotic checkpoint regulator, MAD2B-interacting-domain-containing protein [Xylaria sp. CBS 124048]
MGLVDYSDSESETEVVTKPAVQPPSTGNATKKPSFQKVVDRAKPGRILVNLPGSSSQADENKDDATVRDEPPPSKRPRLSRGGAFSGFNSLLPPPKNVGKKPAALATSSAPRPGSNLKTGAVPGFNRIIEKAQDDTVVDDPGLRQSGDGGGMSLPAPKSQQPTIPEGQKPAEEVKLVGKPLMFKPLSVTRKKPTNVAAKPTTTSASPATTAPTAQPVVPAAQPPPKKISLFSVTDDEPDLSDWKDTYDPATNTDDTSKTLTADDFAAYDAQFGHYKAPPQATTVSSAAATGPISLDDIASDMNLSAAARRELFGRRGAPSADIAAARVINFNTEREYAHNEVLRASGEQQVHNPVRSIAPGKHNLRQLVNQVHNQRDALEECFAQGKAKQNEAGSRYGWR